MQRMGATGGGVWGAALPRELLREAYPMKSVVSGAEVRKVAVFSLFEK